MGELEVLTKDPAAAARALSGVLAKLGADRGEAAEGVAGSVETAWRRWTLPDGRVVEMWSDNYTPLSLRCERTLAAQIAAEAGVELADG